MNQIIEALGKRRSVLVDQLGAPGPNAEQIATLLRLATRIPDHGKLTPWRFILIEGAARDDFGALIAGRFLELNPTFPAKRIDYERQRPHRAPVIIAVISCAADHPRIPQWEQILSCGAACFSLLTAATAMGFGAQWITEWIAYDAVIATGLGLQSDEKIGGFIYIGTAATPPQERDRPDPDSLLTRWQTAS